MTCSRLFLTLLQAHFLPCGQTEQLLIERGVGAAHSAHIESFQRGLPCSIAHRGALRSVTPELCHRLSKRTCVARGHEQSLRPTLATAGGAAQRGAAPASASEGENRRR
jgi:hypothetical protein